MKQNIDLTVEFKNEVSSYRFKTSKLTIHSTIADLKAQIAYQMGVDVRSVDLLDRFEDSRTLEDCGVQNDVILQARITNKNQSHLKAFLVPALVTLTGCQLLAYCATYARPSIEMPLKVSIPASLLFAALVGIGTYLYKSSGREVN